MRWTRSRKRAIAGTMASWSGAGSAVRSGTASGRRRRVCSQRSCRGTRLVTSSVTPGQAASSAASWEAAGNTCSKLSRMSSSVRSRRYSASRSSRGRRPLSTMPSLWASVGSTRLGSRTGARSTSVTPSGNLSAIWAPASRARRVLPTPAGPVTVSRRTCSPTSHWRMVSSSSPRPRSGVACV